MDPASRTEELPAIEMHVQRRELSATKVAALAELDRHQRSNRANEEVTLQADSRRKRNRTQAHSSLRLLAATGLWSIRGARKSEAWMRGFVAQKWIVVLRSERVSRG